MDDKEFECTGNCGTCEANENPEISYDPENCEYNQESHPTVTLTLEDDSERVCDILDIFTYNDTEYIALLPRTEDEETDAFIFRFFEDENGDPHIENIETEEEYAKVVEAFNEGLDLDFEDFEDEEEE